MSLRKMFGEAALLVCAWVAPVYGGYAFTKIADTAGPYAGISQFSHHLSMNESGEVAFTATLDAGGEGVFKGSGGAVTTIYSGLVRVSGQSTSINDAGTVAFRGSVSTAIYAGDGSAAATVIHDPVNHSSLRGPSLNNSGNVVFAAQGPYILTGSSDPMTTVADSSGPYSTFNTNPEINNAGQIAWSASYDSPATHQTLYRSLGAVSTVIADTAADGFTFLDEMMINSNGEIAFGANRTNSVGIYRGSGGGTVTTIVDNAGPYSFFTDGNLRPKPGLNDNGDVAFWAELDGPVPRVQGIFTGPNPATDTVIKTGDTLFGSVVTDLAFSGRGFNNGRQIAFVAVLADGRTAVVRADVPEPGFALALAGLLLGSRCLRRRSRRAKVSPSC